MEHSVGEIPRAAAARGEEFVIRIEQNKFSVHRGDTLIASGSLRAGMSAVWLEQRERGTLPS